MDLGERTKVNVPAFILAAGLLAWLLFLTQTIYQVKEDVAVIKATVVNSAKIAAAAADNTIKVAIIP